MSVGKKSHHWSNSPDANSPKPAPRWANWKFGALMAICVAVGNVIYYLFTGESLPSPRYGSLTRHGHEANPGGAIALTVAMLLFALFCYLMHRRQLRLKREIKKQS
jgi:hypothetical protein